VSHAAPKSDAERTAIMLDLLHREYEGGRSDLAPPYVLIEEVAPGTGFSGPSRYADVVALSTWPSRGLTLEGFELKASKADLRRELADPSKHKAVARYCDEWSLVVYRRSILEGLDIPADWGIWAVDDETGEKLELIRKPAKRTPDPWPRSFVCSLVRNAHQQSPRAAFIARAVIAAEQSGQKNATDAAWREVEHTLHPLAKALGFSSWNEPSLEKLVTLAVDELVRLREALKNSGKTGSGPRGD
jgi:hypothetical protein